MLRLFGVMMLAVALWGCTAQVEPGGKEKEEGAYKANKAKSPDKSSEVLKQKPDLEQFRKDSTRHSAWEKFDGAKKDAVKITIKGERKW